MTPDKAREIADTLLLHILQDPELTSSLIGRSGMDPGALRAAIDQPGIHEFVLDFIVEDDDRVISCADATGIAASEIGMAARVLARRD